MKKIITFAGMISGALMLAGCCCIQQPSCANATCDDDRNVDYLSYTKPAVNYKKVKKVNKNAGICIVSGIPGLNKNCILKMEAVGVGVAPSSGMESAAQAMAMARRAAILEGYKSLAEKLYGIKINGRETLKNMMLQNESLRAYIQGVIRGANIEQESFKDGMYRVVMTLKVNVNEWNKFLKNNPPYSLSSM
jgi:hypothetical protein